MAVYGGTATFTGCYIYDNEAYYVRLGPTPFHGPHGRSFQEVSLVLAGRRRVRQWIEHSGELQWL